MRKSNGTERRNAVVRAIERASHSELAIARTKALGNSRTLYWDSTHRARYAVTTSKRHIGGKYWYGYYEKWDVFLKDGIPAHYVICCIDPRIAFKIPRSKMKEFLPNLSRAVSNLGTFWHVVVVENNGKFELLRQGGSKPLNLTRYKMK
jgi:hypothetical protein